MLVSSLFLASHLFLVSFLLLASLLLLAFRSPTFCSWCVPAVPASILLLEFPSVGDVLAVAGILVFAVVSADADFPIVASVFFTQKSDVI